MRQDQFKDILNAIEPNVSANRAPKWAVNPTCSRGWKRDYHKNKVRFNLLLSLFIDRSANTSFQRSVVIFPKWSTKTVGNFRTEILFLITTIHTCTN